MNARQRQSVYLCPRCNGEDQSFVSGIGDVQCSMYCHTCGHSINNVVPGATPYGPLNPRVKITTGRYTRNAPPPPPPQRLPPNVEPKYIAMQEKIVEKETVENFIAMETAMDQIPIPEISRWELI